MPSGDDASITLNIVPKVKYQAIHKDGTKDPIDVGAPTNAELPKDAASVGTITINFTVPVGFVTGDADLYVSHKDYVYKATGSNNKYTFSNPHGFSEFVISKTNPAVAQTGAVGSEKFYGTLQAAIDDAVNNAEITILKAGLMPVSVNEEITLKLKTTNTTSITLDYLKTLLTAGNSVDRAVSDNGNDTVTFVFTAKDTPTPPPSSGSSGGGVSSNVTIDRPANGKVSVTPTAPSKGATVTINLTPDTGYVVGTVTVTDKDGKAVELTKVSDTKYTFTMPDGKVTVKATFTKADAPADGFTDVPADAYYADAVKWAVEKGITNGLTATTFGPNNSCTRGQMVTFLWRAAGSPAATGTNSFSDVASGEYYYNAVLWAVEKGITNGTSATTFSPNATVNRGQTVTFLYRYAESPAATGTSSFTDVAADAFYADAVKWAVAEEITNGTSSTTFSPASNCTRGQIVTFLYRQMAE